MRKFAIAFAALAAFGIAMPLTSSAKAEDTVVIKKDGDHDRNMHRHHKKIVVIKHRRHRDDDHKHDHD
jgi:hypothetical protein